jgi:hypothetical protein
MSSYEVGSIVYLLNKETLKIIPSVIKEEITKKTIDDIDIHYVLELPDKSLIEMSDIKEKVFKDIESLREFMLDNTRKSVERLIKNAVEVENAVFRIGDNNLDTIKIDEKRVQNDIKSVIMNSEETNNTNSKEEK